jgi:enterochelin esterase-like enzyme
MLDGNTDLTDRILSCATDVHRQLGPGLLESVYESALSIELRYRGIPFKRQLGFPLYYRGKLILRAICEVDKRRSLRISAPPRFVGMRSHVQRARHVKSREVSVECSPEIMVTRLMHIIAILGLTATSAAAQARTVRHQSTSLDSQRIFSILLPPGYADSDKRYPVVYLFHGGGQDHTAFMARAVFAPLARKQDAIFVMPAADRNYSSLSADGQTRYNSYVATELVDYIDATYRTIASPPSRAIAGISMGGRIATMTALQHPQRFGVVGAFSAALPLSAVLRTDANDAVAGAAGSATYFYVSCGTRDALLPASQQFVMRLAGQKLAHEYHEIPGGEHTWNVWDEELRVFLSVLSKRPTWRSS